MYALRTGRLLIYYYDFSLICFFSNQEVDVLLYKQEVISDNVDTFGNNVEIERVNGVLCKFCLPF